MIRHNEVMKKGSFKVINSSAKRYACKKGELILTSESLSIDCGGNWSRTIPIEELDLEAHDGKLKIYFGYYRTRFLKLIVDDPEGWLECFKEVKSQYFGNVIERMYLMEIERPKELQKLLDMKPEALRRLYNDISKELNHLRQKVSDLYWICIRCRARAEEFVIVN